VPFDGVMDHAVRLTTALDEHLRVELLTRDLQGHWRTTDGTRRTWQDVRTMLRASDSVVLSYAPWNLGLGWKHWRFVIELPKLAWAARRARRVLFLHELSSANTGFLGNLDRRVQHRQFRMVSKVFPTVAGATFLLPGRLARGRTLLPLPMGSNLPDMRHARDAVREELGLDSSLVVASFVQAYLSPVRRLVSAGLEGCRDGTASRVTHLALGASAEPEPVEGVTEYRAGAVSAERLAALLACADLVLAPFPDGASTRRTTLAAALQHGVPVITNAGAHTAPWLLSSTGLAITDPEEASFRARAHLLAQHDAQRLEAARAARRLYDEHYRWRAVAAELARHLTPRSGPSRQSPARQEEPG
jgi:glycosyltransferase involved in cell wall biosynthesis